MIHQVEAYKFYEIYLAFHLARDDESSPWVPIGFVMSYGNQTQCTYLRQYKCYEKEFKEECYLAGDLTGTYDFIHKWHLRHQQPNEAVTKVIKYCSLSNQLDQIIIQMRSTYLGANAGIRFGMLAIMLKSRDLYFPIVYDTIRKDHDKIVQALKNKGLIGNEKHSAEV